MENQPHGTRILTTTTTSNDVLEFIHQHWRSLPVSLEEHQLIKRLCLIYCTQLTALPDSIGVLSNLTELALVACDTLTSLPIAIGQLTTVSKLDLSFCVNLQQLPYSIGNMQMMMHLILFTCTALTQLPESVCQLALLKELDARHCSSLTELPAQIGNLMSLDYLGLFNCVSLKALPSSIGHLHVRLVQLDGCNRLLDSLPAGTNLSRHWCQIKKYLFASNHPLKILLIALSERRKQKRRLPRELWDLIYEEFLSKY